MTRPSRRRVAAAAIIAALFLYGGVVAAKSKDKSKPKPKAPVGFQFKNINSVVITRYAKMSDSRDNPNSSRVSVIKNKETVARLLELINAMPAKGTMMKKIADVEYIQAAFYGHYDSPPVIVDLFGGRVQAPDTSFYEGLPQEAEIYRILSEAKAVPKRGLRVASAKSVSVEEYDHAVYAVKELAPNRAVKITDPKTTAALLELLNQMPLKGDAFISYTSGVPFIQVYFIEDNGEETLVKLYGGKISTTDGSFYKGGPGEEPQKKFVEILAAELAKTAPEARYAFDAENAQTALLQIKKNERDDEKSWERVSDPKFIRKIQDALAKLPTKGEMMKSWSEDAEVLSVTFSRPGAPQTYIEFYNGRIKTLDGSFYSAGSNPEKPLYELLKKQFKYGSRG